MNITKESITEQTNVIKIKITKSDYEENYEKAVRNYKKQVKLDGFRAGMIPTGLVKKMYGKALMLEEINKLISESLNNYITENKIKIIGDPIPCESNNTIDLDNPSEFEFSFDIGLYPEFELKFSKREKYQYFDITVDDKMIEDEIEYYTNYFGELKETDLIADDSVVVEGDMIELDDNGKTKESGVINNNVKIYLQSMKDEDSKKKFYNSKVGDLVTFNPKVALPNETDRSLLLGVSKEQTTEIESDFQLTIKLLKKFTKSELNQTLFDKVFGENVVKSEEEFKTKVIERLKSRFDSESNYKFRIDSKEKLLEKTQITLPEEFLKRWVTLVNQKLTKEQIDNEFSMFIDDLKWQIIKEKIFVENKFDISHEDLKKEAVNIARYQFAQYGINNVTDEQAESMSEHIIKDEKKMNKLHEKILEDKIFDFVKENVKLENKEISIAEFQKMFKTQKN